MSKLTVKVSYDYDRDIEVTVRVTEDVVDALNEAIFNVLNKAMSTQSQSTKQGKQVDDGSR